MTGVLDVLAGATPVRRSVTMCLDGATQAEVDAIEATFQNALDHDLTHGSLGNPTPSLTGAVEAREALRDKIAASEVTFVFERVPWPERVALQAEHPPRTGHLADLSRGFNYETFLPELVRRSIVEVVGHDGDTKTRDEIPAATWEALFGKPAIPAEDTGDGIEVPAVAGSLNAAQVNKLVDAATAVNEQGPSVPRSARSLLVSQDSGASSTPPGPGTSAPAGSTDGNPPTPASSSTGAAKTKKRASATRKQSAKSAAS